MGYLYYLPILANVVLAFKYKSFGSIITFLIIYQGVKLLSYRECLCANHVENTKMFFQYSYTNF